MNIKFEKEEDTDKTITTESEDLQMSADKHNVLESHNKNISKILGKNENYINDTVSSPSYSFKSLDIIPLITPYSKNKKIKIKNNSISSNFKNKIFFITKIKKNLISNISDNLLVDFSEIKQDYKIKNSNREIKNLKRNLANYKLNEEKLSINDLYYKSGERNFQNNNNNSDRNNYLFSNKDFILNGMNLVKDSFDTKEGQINNKNTIIKLDNSFQLNTREDNKVYSDTNQIYTTTDKLNSNLILSPATVNIALNPSDSFFQNKGRSGISVISSKSYLSCEEVAKSRLRRKIHELKSERNVTIEIKKTVKNKDYKNI